MDHPSPPIPWRRHLTLWWRQFRTVTWVAISAAHVSLAAVLLTGSRSQQSLGAFAAMGFVVGQVGLWFAVGEREERRLAAKKGRRK